MKTTIWFDGGSNPNPGPSYGSYEISDESDKLTRQSLIMCWKTPNSFTNNQAEYMTLWLALHDYIAEFLHCSADQLVIWSDSKLLVEQLNGRWKVKHPKMKFMKSKIDLLLKEIPSWEIKWNSREVNVAKFGH